MRWIFLPGFDGTGELFAPLRRCVPSNLAAHFVSYPNQSVRDYRDLMPILEAAVPPSGSCIIVAESFSGPLALLFAGRRPPQLKSLILCASFAKGPRIARLFEPFAWLAFRLPPPRWLVRRYLLGEDSPSELLQTFTHAVAKVSPAVMCSRMRSLRSIDVRSMLTRISVPVLYIQALQDRLIPSTAAAEIEAAVPNAQIARIDAPHFVLQRRPEQAWRTMEEFASQIGA